MGLNKSRSAERRRTRGAPPPRAVPSPALPAAPRGGTLAAPVRPHRDVKRAWDRAAVQTKIPREEIESLRVLIGEREAASALQIIRSARVLLGVLLARSPAAVPPAAPPAATPAPGASPAA